MTIYRADSKGLAIFEQTKPGQAGRSLFSRSSDMFYASLSHLPSTAGSFQQHLETNLDTTASCESHRIVVKSSGYLS